MSQRRINQQQQQNPSQQQKQQQHVVKQPSNEVAGNSNNDPQLQQQQLPSNNAPAGVVTPELLVDALSGHEDGLLAIAERLMEHYDRGYDVMGEAIIDAFADVQRLFQHAVEAAHMEGAAMEANRQREAVLLLGGEGTASHDEAVTLTRTTSSGQQPHPIIEEFVDDDVMEVLREAIQLVSKAQRQQHQATVSNSSNNNANTTNSTSTTTTTSSGNNNNHNHKKPPPYVAWYEIYEKACNSASALLPVDSDHRGRLQLAIARAENVSPDRACAILRYAMEDVLRCTTVTTTTPFRLFQEQPTTSSEQHNNNNTNHPGTSSSMTKPITSGTTTVMSSTSTEPAGNGLAVVQHQQEQQKQMKNAPLPATRGDCVLEDLQSQQRSEEILDSLLEEMKEILSAPLYENSPIQKVASKFWDVLMEERRLRLKKEEFLEEKLGKLKGEYLLEKSEWEELANSAAKDVATWKAAYLQLKRQQQQQSSGIEQFIGSITYSGGGGTSTTFGDADSDSLAMEDASSFLSSTNYKGKKRISGAASVISQASSSVAHHAKSILTCGSSSGGGVNERNKSVATTATTTTTTSSRSFIQP